MNIYYPSVNLLFSLLVSIIEENFYTHKNNRMVERVEYLVRSTEI